MPASVVRELASGAIGIAILAGVALGGYAIGTGWAHAWMGQYPHETDGSGCDGYLDVDTGDPVDVCSPFPLTTSAHR
jgi:hypothetical protein